MPTGVTNPSQIPSSRAFEDEARLLLNRVRRSFAALLDAVAHMTPASGTPTATDLQRTLGIPTTLAWRVHRVARAENPFREVESIPGSTAIQRVVEQGEKKGLPSKHLAEVSAAVREFEMLVREHAGNRQTFNAMVASLAGKTESVIDSACRKAAFQANSQIWGVQTRALLWTGMYYPGAHNRIMQNAILMGAADVKRLHADVSPHEIRLRIRDSEHACEQKGSEGSGRFGPVLLEEYSTQPLPVVNRTVDADGWERLQIQPPTMGTSGATSFFVAEGSREVHWSPNDPEDAYAVPDVRCSTPAEVLIVDVLVYRDMFGAIEPQAGVFDGRSSRASNRELFARRRLPVNVHAEHLGTGLDAMHTSDLPRYPAMIGQVCDQLGWDASRFDVYRCRVEYPIMSSLTAIWFPMPEKGNW